MDGIFFLIPLGLVMGLVGLVAFFWTLRSGQYEDLKGAAERILVEDEQEPDRAGQTQTALMHGHHNPHEER